MGWYDALRATRVSEPERKTRVIQKILWFEVFQKLWETRNNILNHSENVYKDQENEELGRR